MLALPPQLATTLRRARLSYAFHKWVLRMAGTYSRWQSMRTTRRLMFSPASCTVFDMVNPAFPKALNDLRLYSSGSVITALTLESAKTAP
jgi:hypothetical protein